MGQQLQTLISKYKIAQNVKIIFNEKRTRNILGYTKMYQLQHKYQMGDYIICDSYRIISRDHDATFPEIEGKIVGIEKFTHGILYHVKTKEGIIEVRPESLVSAKGQMKNKKLRCPFCGYSDIGVACQYNSPCHIFG